MRIAIGADHAGFALKELLRAELEGLDDEVTVNRYRQEGSVVWLLHENEDFKPIQVDLAEQEMVIEGVVVGVIRDSMSLH